MQRFLVLYTENDSVYNKYAEGLIHYDRTVYVRGLLPEKREFTDMQGLNNHLRDDDNIYSYHILMIDKDENEK